MKTIISLEVLHTLIFFTSNATQGRKSKASVQNKALVC